MKTAQYFFIGFTIGLIAFCLAALLSQATHAEPAPLTPEQCLASGFVVIQDGTPRPLNKSEEMEAFKAVVKGCQERYGADYCPSKVYLNTSNGHVGVVCERVRGEEA